MAGFVDRSAQPGVVSAVPFITLKDEVTPTIKEPSPRFRLGCRGHVALFMAAFAVSCQMAYWTAVREAASSGRTPSPDNMGLGWPLLVPFVYLGLLAIYWIVRLLVAGIAWLARRSRPAGN